MDMSSGKWLADMGNEDSAAIIHHCHMMMSSNNNVNMEGLDNLLSHHQPKDPYFNKTEDEDFELISSLEKMSYYKHDVNNNNNEVKKQNNNESWRSNYSLSTNYSCERVISFGNVNNNDANIKPNYKEKINYVSGKNDNALVKNSQQRWKYRVGSTSLTPQEHALGERRRREKLGESFAALSALVPGLKKMDKASILGGAAKYIKKLEEQVKKLEEGRVESAKLVKKSRDNNEDVNYENGGESKCPDMVDIEARISNKNVLIRVHTLKKDDLLVPFVLKEIENLGLIIVNFISMPFGKYAMDLTIMAQIIDDRGKSMNPNDVVKKLGFSLQEFITSL